VKDLATQYDGEKGKLSAGGAWLWLVVISKTGYDTVRYTNDNAAGTVFGIGNYVIWPSSGGSAYYSCPIHMDDVSASLEGKFPDFKVSIGDVDVGGKLRPNLSGAGGYIGGTIRIMVVHSDHLSLTEAAIDETATITGCEVRAGEVVFTAGITSKLDKRFPRDRYTPGFCRHKFGGAMCGYTISSHSFTSSLVEFYPDYGGHAEQEEQLDIIFAYGNELIDYLLTGAKGEDIGSGRYKLTYDTLITVSGSAKENDGVYKLLKSSTQNEQFVIASSVHWDADDEEQSMTKEAQGAAITMTLGMTTCDHTLEHCRQRNNLNRFGGSPGVAGGAYA